MDSYTSPVTGRLLITIGVVSIVTFILLLIFFIGYFQGIPALYVFGTTNDVLNSAIAMMSAGLVTYLALHHPKKSLWFWLSLPLLVAAWIGAAIGTIDSLRSGGILSNAQVGLFRIKYNAAFLAEHNLHFGFGLISFGIIAVIFYAYQHKLWPTNLVVLGMFASLFMMIGLVGDLGSLGFIFLYPVWAILLGRWILSTDKRTNLQL